MPERRKKYDLAYILSILFRYEHKHSLVFMSRSHGDETRMETPKHEWRQRCFNANESSVLLIVFIYRLYIRDLQFDWRSYLYLMLFYRHAATRLLPFFHIDNFSKTSWRLDLTFLSAVGAATENCCPVTKS